MHPIFKKPTFSPLRRLRLQSEWTLGAACFFVVWLGIGCGGASSKQEANRRKASANLAAKQFHVLDECETLYKKYLAAQDINAARELLCNEIAVAEKATELEPEGRAFILFLENSRLFALEASVDNKLAAEAAFIKARYWNLTRHELLGVPLAKSVEEINSLSADKTVELIRSNDLKRNHGKPAAYIQKLPEHEPVR